MKIEDLKRSYNKIFDASYSITIKKKLLESILMELRQIDNNQKSIDVLPIYSNLKNDQTITNYTSVSQLTINSALIQKNYDSQTVSSAFDLQKRQLQEKIIMRQHQKCFLNQEIENSEDDLFQIRKILQIKKDVNQELDKAIAKKSYQISKKSCRKSVVASKEEERHSWSARVKHFFHM